MGKSLLGHRDIGQPLDNQSESVILKLMGSEFGIFFDPLSKMSGSMLIGQYWSEQKKIKREDQLAVCADGKMSNDPLMPNKVIGGINHSRSQIGCVISNRSTGTVLFNIFISTWIWHV